MRLSTLCYYYTLALLCSPSLQQSFSEPTYQIPHNSGRYASNDVWVLGSTREVIFETPWPAYRIELWQELEFVESAIKSEQNTLEEGEELPQSFEWTVTTNELELSDTPIFFLWMFEVNASNPEPGSKTSAYFNITEEALTTSSSSSSSTTSSPSTSTTSTTSTTSASVEPNSSPTLEPATTGGSSGLSTGAQAGIGVAMAVVGLIAVICAVLLWRNKRKSRRMQEAMQQQQQYAYYPQPGELPKYGGGPPTEAMTEAPTAAGSGSIRSELPGGARHRMIDRSTPVELDAGNR